MLSAIRKPWWSVSVLSLSFAISACMASGTASPDAASAAASATAASPAAAAPTAPLESDTAMPSESEPAQPAPSTAGAHVGEPVGNGPFGQFIVKYREGTAPLTQQAAVQSRLDRTGKQAGLANKSGLKLTWKHRMGIQADVFSVSPALDRAEAVRLMQTFAADPDVQFIEPDNHITLDPIIRGPAVIDK